MIRKKLEKLSNAIRSPKSDGASGTRRRVRQVTSVRVFGVTKRSR
jgi:hypothetical protein